MNKIQNTSKHTNEIRGSKREESSQVVQYKAIKKKSIIDSSKKPLDTHYAPVDSLESSIYLKNNLNKSISPSRAIYPLDISIKHRHGSQTRTALNGSLRQQPGFIGDLNPKKNDKSRKESKNDFIDLNGYQSSKADYQGSPKASSIYQSSVFESDSSVKKVNRLELTRASGSPKKVFGANFRAKTPIEGHLGEKRSFKNHKNHQNGQKKAIFGKSEKEPLDNILSLKRSAYMKNGLLGPKASPEEASNSIVKVPLLNSKSFLRYSYACNKNTDKGDQEEKVGTSRSTDKLSSKLNLKNLHFALNMRKRADSQIHQKFKKFDKFDSRKVESEAVSNGSKSGSRIKVVPKLIQQRNGLEVKINKKQKNGQKVVTETTRLIKELKKKAKIDKLKQSAKRGVSTRFSSYVNKSKKSDPHSFFGKKPAPKQIRSFRGSLLPSRQGLRKLQRPQNGQKRPILERKEIAQKPQKMKEKALTRGSKATKHGSGSSDDYNSSKNSQKDRISSSSLEVPRRPTKSNKSDKSNKNSSKNTKSNNNRGSSTITSFLAKEKTRRAKIKELKEKAKNYLLKNVEKDQDIKRRLQETEDAAGMAERAKTSHNFLKKTERPKTLKRAKSSESRSSSCDSSLNNYIKNSRDQLIAKKQIKEENRAKTPQKTPKQSARAPRTSDKKDKPLYAKKHRSPGRDLPNSNQAEKAETDGSYQLRTNDQGRIDRGSVEDGSVDTPSLLKTNDVVKRHSFSRVADSRRSDSLKASYRSRVKIRTEPHSISPTNVYVPVRNREKEVKRVQPDNGVLGQNQGVPANRDGFEGGRGADEENDNPNIPRVQVRQAPDLGMGVKPLNLNSCFENDSTVYGQQARPIRSSMTTSSNQITPFNPISSERRITRIHPSGPKNLTRTATGHINRPQRPSRRATNHRYSQNQVHSHYTVETSESHPDPRIHPSGTTITKNTSNTVSSNDQVILRNLTAHSTTTETDPRQITTNRLYTPQPPQNDPKRAQESSNTSLNPYNYEKVDEVYPDGSHYKGYKLNNKKHGQGSLTLSNGSRYHGDWRDDLMNGIGRLYYETGDIAYEGGFMNNRVQGHGKMHNDKPSRVFMGEEVVVDHKDLDCIKDNWETFDGTFEKNSKEGLGTWRLLGGHVFVGEFKNDLADGKGIFTYGEDGVGELAGRKFAGVWKDNKLVQVFF